MELTHDMYADLIAERGNHSLEPEVQKRLAFRTWPTPSMVAELIYGHDIVHSPVMYADPVYSSNLPSLVSQHLTHGELAEVVPPLTLMIEIISKSAKLSDRVSKHAFYLAHRVVESWSVDPIKNIIDQYLMVTDTADNDEYQLVGSFHGEHFVDCPEIGVLGFPAAPAFSTKRSLTWVRDPLAK